MLVLCPVMMFRLCCLITHLCPMPVNLDKYSKVSFKSNNKKIIYCKCASVKHFWSIFTWAQSKGIGKRLLRPGIANISSHHWHNCSNLWKLLHPKMQYSGNENAPNSHVSVTKLFSFVIKSFDSGDWEEIRNSLHQPRHPDEAWSYFMI